MESERYRGLRDRGYPILATLFAGQTLLLVWAGVVRPERMAVKGVDPVGYYAYVRSLVFDRDLDFRNEFTRLQEGGLPVVEPTATGRTANVFSIGPGIFLAPFFLTGHVYALATGYEPRDGYSAPYMVMSFIGLAVYGLLGILLSYAAIRRLYPVKAAFLAVTGGWLATSAAYYFYPIALMPHAISLFAVSLFLWVWLKVRERALGGAGWFGLGLAGGVVMLARWQDGIFLLIPVLDRWFQARRGEGESALTAALSQGEREQDAPHHGPPPQGGREQAASHRGALLTEGRGKWLVFLAGVFIAFLPQLVAWQAVFGRPVLIPQGGGFLLWLRPKVHLLLFSRHNGLVTWTPIALFGLIGLVMFARERKRRSLGIALCGVIAAQIYLNSIVVDWYAGMGFGARRFVGSMPVLTVGLGAFLEWLSRKIRFWQTSILVGLAVAWNALFLVQYYTGLAPWDRPITWRELFFDKIQIVQALERRALERAAVASIMTGDAGSGRAFAAEAAELGPHSPEARMALALAEARLGGRERAAGELRAAAEILDGTEYVRGKFSSMLRRAGMGGEVGYYEGVLREVD